LPRELLDYHVHAHLDVFVDGQPQPVAQYIGIDLTRGVLSSLHTHDTSGIIHIEAGKPVDLTVGQFFDEWNVRLTDDCVGAYCQAERPWKFVVNGADASGEPRAIVLHAHDELALVIGNPPASVPSSFSFPAGY
jgi:hypothetical protein